MYSKGKENCVGFTCKQQEIPSNELKTMQQRSCVCIIVYNTTVIYSSSLGTAVPAHVSAERLTTRQHIVIDLC